MLCYNNNICDGNVVMCDLNISNYYLRYQHYDNIVIITIWRHAVIPSLFALYTGLVISSLVSAPVFPLPSPHNTHHGRHLGDGCGGKDVHQEENEAKEEKLSSRVCDL